MLFTIVSLSVCLATPSHPSDIVFPEYVFTPPVASEFRETVLNDIPVYIVEDRELPLINVVATFRGGDYLDSASSVGLTGMMASLIRDGGTSSLSAEDLDERLAFLATNCGVRGGWGCTSKRASKHKQASTSKQASTRENTKRSIDR